MSVLNILLQQGQQEQNLSVDELKEEVMNSLEEIHDKVEAIRAYCKDMVDWNHVERRHFIIMKRQLVNIIRHLPETDDLSDEIFYQNEDENIKR